jgi:hypothetical protein
MSGTRALFASIGASVLLVGAAALSLLAVSAVFAFGGWSDPVAESAGQSALVLAGDDGADAGDRKRAFVLPPRPRQQSSRPSATPTAPRPQGSARAAEQAAITPATSRRPRASSFPQSSTKPELDVAPQTPAPRKSAGDGVRTAGEGLSGRVQDTGDAIAGIVDPLLPPVTAAAQKVLDAVAELLRRTTNGLGSTVDRVLPAK